MESILKFKELTPYKFPLMPDFDNHNEMQLYSGVPKRSNPTERSAWKKFLGFFIPWLSHKYELSERYLEAKVVHEEAQAFKTFAEALTSLETARKIAAEAAIKEEEKMQPFGDGPFTEADARAQAEILAKKIQYLQAVYGLRLVVESKQADSAQPIDKS